MSYITFPPALEKRVDAYWEHSFASKNKPYDVSEDDPTFMRDIARNHLTQLGKDGLCQCDCADICPNRKCGSMGRCSKSELEAVS
jgi:hypothetical protein